MCRFGGKEGPYLLDEVSVVEKSSEAFRPQATRDSRLCVASKGRAASAC